MAKKIAAEKVEPEVIAKCDNLNEVTPNHDEVITSVAQIKSMIRLIRGQQVMLDFDLAFLYGVETKALNQAVKRNINRFPEDFMFKLTKSELEILRSQIVTSNPIERQQNTNWKSQIVTSNLDNNHGSDILMSQNATSSFAKMGLRRPPYAFTRNGVAMLSSVLRSQTAVGVNIKIMRAFTAIPQLVNNNAQMPKLLPEQIFQTGCVWDAWSYISDLVRTAQQRIVLIDNFVDDRVLSLLTKRADDVTATIHTRYSEQFLTDLKKHNEQYPEITFVQLPHRNHDRFLIVDNKAYLLGASLKDIGTGLCAVTELTASPETILEMLK